ncbi:hypothetical protein EKH57_17460 (plasmid) [Halorubrum sp. BOL3-1]|uniref:hypothetical protein n=1 Tax=Halorubrum sp. BOL3-1 TaxID=2497325 RepID=UPI001004F4D1|nr:hypothetical protein [Halorubrum sp. BOL3-1]QAU14473.1 hypothetical protein EKH57_17460 [Halorubrum sp. BOL3-1]
MAKDPVEEFYNSLMNSMNNADQSLGALEVLVTVKGFEQRVQEGYAKELGLDEEQLDRILSQLIDATVEGGENVDPETLRETIDTTEGFFDQ